MTHPFFVRVERRLSELGKTKTWLAEQSGVSIHTLNAAAYRNTPPKLGIALSIADALGASLDWLVAGKDDRDQLQPDNDYQLSLETIGAWARHEYGLSRDALQLYLDMIVNAPLLSEALLAELRGWIRGCLDTRNVAHGPAFVDIDRIMRQANRLEDRSKRF